MGPVVRIELERVEELELLGMALAHLNDAEVRAEMSPRVALLMAIRDKLALGLREENELQRFRGICGDFRDGQVQEWRRGRSGLRSGRRGPQRRESSQETGIRDDMIRVAHRAGASIRQISDVSGLGRKTVTAIVSSEAGLHD